MSEVIENPALYLPTPAPVLETLQKSSKGTTSRLTAKAATRQFLIDKVNKSGKSESINERLYSGIITKSHPKYKFSKNMTAKVTSCRNSKASRNANRNVGQLSCRLKRQMQRHDMNCKTISYDSLVTFHSMWLEYARELLCIDHYKKQGWTANPCDTATETIQNKFKKIEYFGAQCEVTASSCTSLVGLKGIIIKESKSCFTVVTKDNLVKNVPKVNSEFMFEIDGVQFIVMGAHIYQRPVERAKHNLKKLHLWTCGRP